MSNAAEQWMRRAIELSKNGFPAPNPHVGCVIVKNGEIVGEAYHDHAGAPHAEVVALTQAREKANGADVFVTLEPCNHQGRTGPCSQALIQAGVANVTAACLDPNPKAKGGLKALKESGVKVSHGLMQKEASAANEVFLKSMEQRSPYLVGKVAMSLDGRVAMPNGDSKWITNEASRAIGHRLRAECGAVLVGRNTVARDNPHLTARVEGVVNQPKRIVLDPNSALSGMEHVFDNTAPTLHVVKQPVREGQIKAPMTETGIDLSQLLMDLFEQGIIGILVEGGPVTLGHFIQQKLLDRLEVFIAPKALGAGPSWLSSNLENLEDAFGFRLDCVSNVEGDLWATYRPV